LCGIFFVFSNATPRVATAPLGRGAGGAGPRRLKALRALGRARARPWPASQFNAAAWAALS